MTYGELFKKFCAWSINHARMVVNYRPWGRNSIVVWLSSGLIYKVKYIDDLHFVMQPLSEEDVVKKFGGTNE